eukprot:g15288.t1
MADFFAVPDGSNFAQVSKAAGELRRSVELGEDGPSRARHLGRDMPVSELDFHEVSGLGVPFPVAPVLIQKPATLQLKSGLSMPLLVFAVSGKRRPSVTDLAELLRMGVAWKRT